MDEGASVLDMSREMGRRLKDTDLDGRRGT